MDCTCPYFEKADNCKRLWASILCADRNNLFSEIRIDLKKPERGTQEAGFDDDLKTVEENLDEFEVAADVFNKNKTSQNNKSKSFENLKATLDFRKNQGAGCKAKFERVQNKTKEKDSSNLMKVSMRPNTQERIFLVLNVNRSHREQQICIQFFSRII